jgi:hypothetical protein
MIHLELLETVVHEIINIHAVLLILSHMYYVVFVTDIVVKQCKSR